MNPLTVQKIKHDMATYLVVNHHYLHRRPPISFAYGIIQGNEVVGVLTVGSPASHHLRMSACPEVPSAVMELNRLWVHDDLPRNTESWFIAQALNILPQMILVSYADTAQGHVGTVYRAANFFYAGWTDMDRKTPRFDYMPDSAMPDLLGYKKPPKHTRDASRNGFVARVRRKPKAKYWITTGNRRDRHRLEKLCAWPKLDWNEQPVPI